MCFICTNKTWRIARKAIPVYKILRKNGEAPYRPGFMYHKGYNKPYEQHAHCTYNPGNETYEFTWGILHCFDTKFPFHDKSAKLIKMYIPEGTQYIADGKGEIIAKELYWPTSLMDRIKWHRKSL